MTKKLLLAAVAAAFIAGAANAAVTLTTTDTAYTGPTINLANPTYFNGTTYTTSQPGVAAQPTGAVGAFGAAGPAPNINDSVLSFANFASTGVAKVNFLWGSIDSYNTLSVLGPNNSVLASFTGSSIAPNAQGQANVVLSFTGADRANVTRLRFTSSSQAFEFANAAVAVPEPAAWAMMIGGFGLVGAMARRRRVRSIAVTA